MNFKLLYLFFLLSPSPLLAQMTVLWSDSIVVTSTPHPITAPRIALLPDGTALITWGRSGNGIPSQIWCSRFENAVFSTPVGVVQSPAVPSLFGFGGYDIAVSNSQVFVVFEQLQHGILLATSDDGGLTFGTATEVQGAVPGGYATLASVTVDGTGNPIVSYVRDKNGATYEVRRSTDGGLSFQEPTTANAPAPGGAVCECCTSDLLTSGDSVWMVFRNNNQNLRDIWVTRSTNLAVSFEAATDVDATDWNLNACPIAGPRMARSGDSLLTIWMSQTTGTQRIYLSTLHAGTMHLGQQFNFPSPSGPQTTQSIADVVAVGDTVGVVFLEKSKEIVFCFSTNGLAALPNQCMRFALPNHTLQYPSLAFRDGVFHLVYADPTSDQVLYRRGILSENSSAIESMETTKLGISVFPNPVEAAHFFVKSDTDDLREVSLFDVFGGKVLEQNVLEREAVVPTDNFPQGVYFLKVKTLKGEVSQKIWIR